MDKIPDLMDGDLPIEDSDEDQDGWDECDLDEEDPPAICRCLFCPDEFQSPEPCFVHINGKHQFDIYKISKYCHLDCFGYIKMINFIRGKKIDSVQINKLIHANDKQLPWESDDFMKPVIDDDGLLQFDPEDLTTDCGNFSNSSTVGQSTGQPESETCDSGDSHHKLMQRVTEVERRALLAEERLQEALADLEKMRSVARDLVMSQNVELPTSERAIENLKDDEDEAYFGSYNHFSIHQDMLQDKVRTNSYRDAICNNADAFKDKVVLDVGCGTGILSMFAARAGAKMVIGVEMSDIIYQAMDIIRENGLEDKVKLIKGRMEDVDLPVEKVDIIISEWMGYMLLFESMLDTVLWARNHYLTNTGILLPDKCTMFLSGLDDDEMRQTYYSYWDDVYGFKMSCMKKAVITEPSVTDVKKDRIVSEAVVIKEIDISICRTKDLEFSCPFKLPMRRDGCVTALVSYFDIDFTSCTNKVHFSTGPEHTSTHWKQTVFLLENTYPVKEGDTIEGILTCRKDKKDPRSLLITIKIKDKTFTYKME